MSSECAKALNSLHTTRELQVNRETKTIQFESEINNNDKNSFETKATQSTTIRTIAAL